MNYINYLTSHLNIQAVMIYLVNLPRKFKQPRNKYYILTTYWTNQLANNPINITYKQN